MAASSLELSHVLRMSRLACKFPDFDIDLAKIVIEE